MERFTSYLDGMSLVDKATAVSGYDYYGYNRWGRAEWAIVKIKADGTTQSYLVGTTLASYATAWTNKDTLTFASPSQFNV